MTSNDARATLVRATDSKLIIDEEKRATYEGNYDPTWNIGVVPNGGYTLAIVLHCAHDFVKRRIGKQQEHLFSCNATYLGKVSADLPYTVEVRLLKPGRNTSVLEADILQNSGKQGSSVVCTRVSCIFADFTALRSDPITGQFSFLPNEPFGNTAPLLMDPNDRSKEKPWYPKHKVPTKIVDEKAQEKTKEDEGRLTVVQSMHFPQEEVSAEDMIGHNLTAIAFYMDMTVTWKSMMPPKAKEVSGGRTDFWFPTMTLSIEIAHPIPTYALQNIVTKAKTTFLHQGHWSFEIEIWSHPSDAEKLQLPKGVNSILLAVSRQTALSMSMAVNKKKSSKL
ncbi:uncharacterized protein FA14DRAFT_189627 [Meira miltonrushii]|uniref:Acyl-CoA thioesterase-like N-terminal HotDog domain-containing protein n=1 Tax=Meira miltonrushii TaxID=1280837 RepID=A0A316VF49_9BASI|nr:uncharacterized protein FA14DRAFT_189627 [Meira miltonrushii]PWN35688.1 hypothetical protein FA14DRAFT_189627 [Meira miltonrushii]